MTAQSALLSRTRRLPRRAAAGPSLSSPPGRQAARQRHRRGAHALQAALYDALPDGLVIVRHERIAFANAAAARLLAAVDGRSLVGVPITRLVDARAMARIRCQQARVHGQAASIQADCRALDGAALVAELSISTVRFEACQAVQVLIRDPSEARLQQRLLQHHGELRYRAVLEAVGAAVLVFDAAGQVQVANACAVELLGYSEQALLRMSEDALFATAVDAREVPLQAADRPVPRCLATRLSQRQEVLRLVTGSGVHKWFNVNVRPLPAPTLASRELVACSLTDVTAMKQAQERLVEVAERDELTGLANREYLNRYIGAALEKAARKGDHLAMLVIDLNGFKHVNDSLGHTAGDLLLVEVARRLRAAHRARDLLARRSGDEFVTVLHGVAAPGDLEAYAERIADSLRPAFTIQGHEVFVSASIGAARFPEDAASSDELFRRADAAMYEAKRQGSTGLVLHGHDARQQQVNRLALEAQLRRGLERNEFVLHFQPRYSAATLGLVAVEALIRWNHPRRGLVAPAEFIGLAEETGFIVELGAWVLREACEQAILLQRDALEPIRMSVNISARQFSQTLFAKTIPAIAAQAGLDLKLLELEITETTMMRDSDHAALGALDALRAQGMRVVVDDFGTGYSSLSYLQRFPLDALKIDRSFVQRIPEAPDACAIVQAVVSMARALRLAVVAEGVETEAQRDFMRKLSCDELQGFLLSEPLPASALEPLLAAPEQQ